MKRTCAVLFGAVAAIAAAAVEPIYWTGCGQDDSGEPDGVLLTDNYGWWGRCVYTGVTYDYSDKPDSPRDVLGGNHGLFGRRLLDGNHPTGWHRPVGVTKKRPIEVTFDFRRPCTFCEVDLMSEKSPKAFAKIDVSADGTNWTAFAVLECTNALTRVRPGSSGHGRYMRLSFRARTSSVTYLDEVLAWGNGEVSDEFPENMRPIPRGNALRWSPSPSGGIMWIPIANPTDRSAQQFGQPEFSLEPYAEAGGEIVMARNETEVRYFAVVNGSAEMVELALSASGFGDGVSAELLVGGLVRTQKPRQQLTEKQRFDMMMTGDEPECPFDADKLGIVPFFTVENVPPANFARKHLANPEQVVGFPDRVEIASGECAVVMLRLTSRGARPSHRIGTLTAGAARREVAVRIVDVTLPDAGWVFAWSPFTPQFPFESSERRVNDAKSVAELGVSMFRGGPQKGTKVEMASRERRDRTYFMVDCLGPRLDGLIYNAKIDALDDRGRCEIRSRIAGLRTQFGDCGVPTERVVLAMPDEPRRRNAKICGEVCRFIREAAPDMSIYMNPSFWEGSGFAMTDDIISALGPYYGECVDVSVPYRSLVESEKGRRKLWGTPRRVNASYAHPAHRAGRSIAWANFRYGLDGFAYWCYYWRKTGGNPWDIRTWKTYSLEVNMVLPLENGVAVTPIYEEMREAWEDWRILTALREAGKTELLDALLKEFADSFDPPNMETSRPYKCDFQALRDKALQAFKK